MAQISYSAEKQMNMNQAELTNAQKILKEAIAKTNDPALKKRWTAASNELSATKNKINAAYNEATAGDNPVVFTKDKSALTLAEIGAEVEKQKGKTFNQEQLGVKDISLSNTLEDKAKDLMNDPNASAKISKGLLGVGVAELALSAVGAGGVMGAAGSVLTTALPLIGTGISTLFACSPLGATLLAVGVAMKASPYIKKFIAKVTHKESRDLEAKLNGLGQENEKDNSLFVDMNPEENAIEQPKEGAPVNEGPKEEAPVNEGPKEEAPVNEGPKEGAPVNEGPKEGASKKEEPSGSLPSKEAIIEALCDEMEIVRTRFPGKKISDFKNAIVNAVSKKLSCVPQAVEPHFETALNALVHGTAVVPANQEPKKPTAVVPVSPTPEKPTAVMPGNDQNKPTNDGNNPNFNASAPIRDDGIEYSVDPNLTADQLKTLINGLEKKITRELDALKQDPANAKLQADSLKHRKQLASAKDILSKKLGNSEQNKNNPAVEKPTTETPALGSGEVPALPAGTTPESKSKLAEAYARFNNMLGNKTQYSKPNMKGQKNVGFGFQKANSQTGEPRKYTVIDEMGLEEADKSSIYELLDAAMEAMSPERSKQVTGAEMVAKAEENSRLKNAAKEIEGRLGPQ